MTLNLMTPDLSEIDQLNNLVDSINRANNLLTDIRFKINKLTYDEAVQSQVFASPSDEGYDYAEEENLPQVFGASPRYYPEDWASPEDEYAEEQDYQTEVFGAPPQYYPEVWAPPDDEDAEEQDYETAVFGAPPQYYPEVWAPPDDDDAEERDYQTEVFGAPHQYYPEVWAPPGGEDYIEGDFGAEFSDYQTEVFGAPHQYYPEVWAPPGGEDYIEGDFGAEFSEQQYQAAPDEEWVEGVDVPTLTCRRRRRRGCHSDSSLPSNDDGMCQFYKAYYEANAPCVTSTPKKERMCKFYQAFYEAFAPCVTSTPKDGDEMNPCSYFVPDIECMGPQSPYSPVSPIPLASRVANLNRRVEQLEGELGQQYGGRAPPSQPRVTNFMARNRPMRL